MSDIKFHCPKCKQSLKCGCKACIKRRGHQKDMMIYDETGELESCPKCGYTLHADQWMDIEYEQLIKRANDKD